jgi:hypothetical protein
MKEFVPKQITPHGYHAGSCQRFYATGITNPRAKPAQTPDRRPHEVRTHYKQGIREHDYDDESDSHAVICPTA